MSNNYFGIGGGATGLAGIGAYDAIALRNKQWFNQADKNNRQYAKILNELDCDIELAVLETIFTGRFKWSGSDIDHLYHGYIELGIFQNGYMVACEDPDLGAVILPATCAGWDYMYQPNAFSLIGNGYTRQVNIDECVVIKNDNTWRPPFWLARRKSSIVADTGRAVEVYTQGMKKPMVMAASDKSALTTQSVAQQMTDNYPFILLTPRKDDIGNAKEPFFFHNSPHTSDGLNGLLQAKHAIFAEACAKLGIGAITKTKNAYASSEELDKQESFVELIFDQARNQREKAAEQMRDKFGWDIQVEVTETSSGDDMQPDDAGSEEGGQIEGRGDHV